MQVFVSKELAADLTSYCQSRLPSEACGVLYGDAFGGTVNVKAFRGMQNTAGEPAVRFDFDPEEWIRVLYEAKEPGVRIIGIFHSHPQSPARPSSDDLALGWTFPTYWILSFAGEGEANLKAFRLQIGSFSAQKLNIG